MIKFTARRDTILQAIACHREARKRLVARNSMFGRKFVERHDAQLTVLRELLVSKC